MGVYISARNIAFTCKSISRGTEDELFEILGFPEHEPLSRIDGAPLEVGLPKHLVKAAEWDEWIEEEEEDIRILDFGESFFQGQEPEKLAQPGSHRVPETIFTDSFGYRVDLWRTGCMIYSFVFAAWPFWYLGDDEVLVHQMIGLVGKLPDEWEAKWESVLKGSKHDLGPDGGFSATSMSQLRLTTVPGYFKQDDPSIDPKTFDYVKENFGLIDRQYTEDQIASSEDSQWQRFQKHVDHLNSVDGPRFKVLFLGRHGEGVHNVAESRYGTKLWDDYWSLQDGDSHGQWVDARLTQKGIEQARVAHNAWKDQLQAGIPPPQSFYVSPLNRCLATAHVTFDGLPIAGITPFSPVIKELVRETMGEHTCDRRSSATAIAAEYPHYRFEAGFEEDDLLWDPKTRESDDHRNERLRSLLEDIFSNDENTYISLTAHSGAITSILEVLGHQKFALATGAVIPVLVKAQKPDDVGDASTGEQ
ncbi:unnamed protein product [Penicillium olsonii]|uniref:Uncharacterized protein n=1 Tax=Penicillium olsonii TaxID=99116 RepID=A0A9W4MNU1_PENOL|nr:unnamed protein product [Penicillium olsonii]CAG8036800.1 unnamed protein product [Penicillium olsonii]